MGTLRHLRVTVDGKVYDVVVEEIDAEEAELSASEPGVGLASPPAPTPTPTPTPVAAVPQRASANANEQRAPLGGLILELCVQVGDRVKSGERLLVIEAMKMKTNITAHQDGEITSVGVHLGEVVDAGQMLVTIG